MIRDHDYCRACYAIRLGLPNVAIGRSWLPLEPFPHLIAATRWHSHDSWGDFAIGFLRELPMSLAHNTETVAQILPHLNSLSELPPSLKRYESQLRAAQEALNFDDRTIAAVAAILQSAYHFLQWHRDYVVEYPLLWSPPACAPRSRRAKAHPAEPRTNTMT